MISYRQKRLSKELEALYEKSLRISQKKLASQYLKLAQETKLKLYELLVEIETTNDGLSNLYRYNKYYELINSLNRNLATLGQREVEITEEELIDMYKRTGNIISKYSGFQANMPDENVIKNAVNQVWCADGKAFSSRIWQNKEALKSTLEDVISQAIVRGDAKDKVVNLMMDTMNVGFAQADRIVRTELTWTQNRSAIDRYKDAGIKEYEIFDAGDERECDDCGEMDGKRFPIEDTEHLPPFHPNCRCQVLAVEDKSE